MSIAATERCLCWIYYGGQERLCGSGWCDLTKVEGKDFKLQSYFKGVWAVVREAMY